MAVLLGSGWTTGPTWHHVLYKDWSSSIVTNWSCHHPFISCHYCTIAWHVLHPNHHCISPSLSVGICQVSITLFTSHDPFYYALSSFLSHYVICPYPYSSSHSLLSHDDILPLSLLIHSFSWPTSCQGYSVRKLDLSHLCFFLNFYFLMFFCNFPLCFLTNSFSITHFFICWLPRTPKKEEKQDFDLIDYRKQSNIILWPKNLSRLLNQPLDPMVDL